ncbi:hypothetical protein ACEN88_26085, partial [Massilia sp. CT11-108]
MAVAPQACLFYRNGYVLDMAAWLIQVAVNDNKTDAYVLASARQYGSTFDRSSTFACMAWRLPMKKMEPNDCNAPALTPA